MVLKENRRKVVLGSEHYPNHDFVQYLMKFFKVGLTQLDKANCKHVYQIIDSINWEFVEISKCDFTDRAVEATLWHLVLLRKLLNKGLEPNKILFQSDIITDLYQQPSVMPDVSPEVDPQQLLRQEYILEDTLKLAKDEKHLWNLLRMKISVNLPFIEIDETEAATQGMVYFSPQVKYLEFTSEDIDEHLHPCFQKVIQNFPNCEELRLYWYCDEDTEESIQYDRLFEEIIKSKVKKFELNSCKKMRGFSVFSKQCKIYLYNSLA